MAFVKKTWKDRIVQYANRRLLTKSGGEVEQVTVTRDEGTISEAGDRFDAATMNNLEKRVKDAFDDLNAADLPITSGSATNTKDYIDEKVANIGVIQSLTMPQTLTTTSTTFDTYNSRKFSDYDLIIFKMGSSENDIRQTVVLPQTVWVSGKTINMGALHGASVSTPSSYSYSSVNIQYYSDTKYTAIASGSATLNNLIIWGVKLK